MSNADSYRIKGSREDDMYDFGIGYNSIGDVFGVLEERPDKTERGVFGGDRTTQPHLVLDTIYRQRIVIWQRFKSLFVARFIDRVD